MSKSSFRIIWNHHLFNIKEDLNEIFSGYCNEKNHFQKLEFFCKTQNKLCCAACLCKIEYDGNGHHKDCDVCLIKEINDEKKNKLEENINYLKDLSNNLE